MPPQSAGQLPADENETCRPHAAAVVVDEDHTDAFVRTLAETD
jgi:hypothetical protein